MKRAAPYSPGRLGLGPLRLRESALAAHGDEGAQMSVEPRDAIQIGGDQLDGGNLLLANQRGLARRTRESEIVGGGTHP